ncbi:hypothetical protein V8E55_006885 [Tylopilus felleus]
MSDSGTMKQTVRNEVFDMLREKLEVYEHDGIRTSLRCLDILEEVRDSARHTGPPDSESTSLVKCLVDDSLKRLKNEPWETQKKCVYVLSSLSQMAVGQEVIRSRVNEIVGFLLPEHHWKEVEEQSHSNLEIRPIPPSRMLGPSYALYSLSRNESLCNEIRKSKLYATLKGRYLSGSLVSGPDTPLWQVRTPNKRFSYDGIGSVPETIPVVIQHMSGLGILLRNSVVRALKFLPGLATGFIHGTTTAISRGAIKYTIVRCCYEDKWV